MNIRGLVRFRHLISILLTASGLSHAGDKIELKTTTIKGNAELPKILYLVPWQDSKGEHQAGEQKLMLHSLFGDIYEPVMPESPRQLELKENTLTATTP